MYKKLTITVPQKVYAGLYKVVGRGKISQFLVDLARPHVLNEDVKLLKAYKAMAADEKRESEAQEWSEGTLGDF
jgi:hypothetical protein